MMKLVAKLFFLILLITKVVTLNAQQEKHFIFIQSENKKPYFVQLQNQIYNASPSGYVTIAQLVAGKYYLTINFPNNQFPEQKFVIDINRNENGIGYNLQQFNTNNWRLINMVDSNLMVMSENEVQQSKPDAAMVSTTKTNTIIFVAEKITTIEKPVVKTDSVEGTKIIEIEKLVKPRTENVNIAITKTAANINIIKIFEKIAATNVEQIYVDKLKKKADTIALFFSFIDVKNVPLPNKKCTQMATDNDFFTLRLEMVKAATNDSMILIAKKFFAIKCYAVEQIKNIGFLFLTDANRFTFFQVAQPFISDSEKYSSLQLQLTQPEWIEKFRASIQTK